MAVAYSLFRANLDVYVFVLDREIGMFILKLVLPQVTVALNHLFINIASWHC